MKNIINKIKEYIYMYIKYVPYNNIKYHKDSANCSIFYIPINKIITKWLYCVTENCNIGYPIKYCPVCGAKLE